MNADRFRVVISLVLTVGVTVSAALIALGFGLAVVSGGWQTSLAGGPAGTGSLSDFGQMASGLGALRPVAITQLGLAVLLATPVMRVAASIVAFALERDGLYVVITTIVLVILLASIAFIR